MLKDVLYCSDSPTDTDLSVTPTNPFISSVPSSSTFDYSFKPISPISHRRQLSPISGSFDIDGHSETDSPLTIGSYRNFNKSPTNECPLNELHFETDVDCIDEQSRPESSTNELPLTELNLAIFTSRQATYNDTDLSLRNMLNKNSSKGNDPSDNVSLEVNWESDKSDIENNKTSQTDNISQNKSKTINKKDRKEIRPQHRSYSDPNILKTDKLIQLESNNKESLCPDQAPLYPYSFYPSSNDASVTEDFSDFNHNLLYSNFYARSPTNILSFFSSSPVRPLRSLSHPSPDITEPNMSDTDSASAGTRRHRHSIAGQMSYFKMLGYGFGIGGPLGFKKLAAGSTNSLFSTAVISGSSSAPNLRDMIPSTASASGKNPIDLYRDIYSSNELLFSYRRIWRCATNKTFRNITQRSFFTSVRYIFRTHDSCSIISHTILNTAKASIDTVNYSIKQYAIIQ